MPVKYIVIAFDGSGLGYFHRDTGYDPRNTAPLWYQRLERLSRAEGLLGVKKIPALPVDTVPMLLRRQAG